MRYLSIVLDYLPLEKLLLLIDEPVRSVCQKIYAENRALFETARGSTHNHQTWEGGYVDHVVDSMNFARHQYSLFEAIGRQLPFSLSDALLIIFLHDLEKPWRIEVLPDGSVRNRAGLDTKLAFKEFRESKLKDYGLRLTPDQMNALTYVEGEMGDYSSTHRVMNELSAFCHGIDTWSARGYHNYPKAQDDEWTGAKRFRASDA